MHQKLRQYGDINSYQRGNEHAYVWFRAGRQINGLKVLEAEGSPIKSSSKAHQVRDWLLSFPRAVPASLFAVIMAVTLLSVFAIESKARQTENAKLQEAARAVESALSHRVSDATSYLRAGAALLASVDTPDAELFAKYASQLELGRDTQGAFGIGWAELKGAQVAVDGSPTASSALVRSFELGNGGSGSAIAQDTAAAPLVRRALERAAVNGGPTATQILFDAAVRDNEDAPDFAIVMPVGRTFALAENSPSGFVFVPFDGLALLQAALDSSPDPAIRARLYDDVARPENLVASMGSFTAADDVIEQPVLIADRRFTLAIASPPAGFLTAMSYATLLFGFSVAVLLFILAHMVSRQAAKDAGRLAFFEEQYSIRNSLTRELNHRVKNTLANVLSILSLTRRRSNTLDEFAHSLEGRIRALSATHDLLTQSEWGTTPLRSVIEAELAHVGSGHGDQVNLSGPAVELAPNDALSFGQAIHELATNAAKYGALSDDHGAVSVDWRLVQPHLVEIEWQESGGPQVSGTQQSGFGTDLIQKIVAHELKQPVELHFHRTGVCCILRVAVRKRDDFRIRE